MEGTGSRLRVLHIITSLSVGGAETALKELLAGIDRTRFDCRVVSLTTRAPVGDEIEALGIPVVALGGRSGLLTPAQLVWLVALARRWKPGLIHGWMYHSNLLARCLRPLCRPRPGLIISIRGALDAPDQQKRALRWVRRLDARCSRAADAVLFNSAVSARQHVAQGYDSRNLTLIPNGFDVRRFRPDPVAREAARRGLGVDGEPLVGLVGRFNPIKGQRVFVEAAGLVAAEVRGVRFAMAGRGCDESNAELRSWIDACGLDGRVSLLGERRDILPLHQALDVCVCASLSESFPNAIGEAMSCAVPAVVTDVGDCAALVGDTGRIVPARDPRSLAEGILSLLRLPAAQRRAMGEAARARIIAQFSSERVIARHQQLYESVQARVGGR